MPTLPTPSTRFIDPISVEAWDAWIRWREHHEVRDLTIDATWQRVADAIAGAGAGAEGATAGVWSRRFFEAFSLLQLLPEIDLLRECGRQNPLSLRTAPCAVLNITAFVVAGHDHPAGLDCDRLSAVAVLAVRLLDDVLTGSETPAATGRCGLRIGVIGLADALHLLGLDYDSDEARLKSAEISAIIAEGCLRGAIQLAVERGPTDFDTDAMKSIWQTRETSPELIAEALRHGVRHVHMTELIAQPRLALLANNVADVLDPGMGPGLLRRHTLRWGLVHIGRQGRLHASPAGFAEGYGRNSARSLTIDAVSLRARLQLRAAVQPWFDAPINVPLLVAEEPDENLAMDIRNLAQCHGLPQPQWQTLYPAYSGPD